MRVVLMLMTLSLQLFSANLPLIFNGNVKINSDELYDVLGMRMPYALEIWENKPALDPTALPQSVTAISSYYRSKGYYHSKITSSATDNVLTIVIDENDPIYVKDINHSSPLPIDSAILLKNGDLFDHDKFSTTKSNIKKLYAEAGYCNATFDSKAFVDIETNEAKIQFTATPNASCTFGPINVESTPNIDGKLVESMLRFEEGDPYDLESIRLSYETLYTQEAISRVSINDNERNGSIVPITLNIDEDPQPIRFSAGLGYSSDVGITAQTGLKHRNFFGNLKTFSIDAKYSQVKQEVSGALSIPLPNRTALGTEVGYQNEIFEGYKTSNIYAKLTGKYQSIPNSALIGLMLDRINTYDSTDTTAFPDNILFITSPFMEFNYDTRDKPLEPTKGYWLNAHVAGSLNLPTLSEATYFKSLLSGSYITSFGKHVLGTRVKWGTLRLFDGTLPSSYRFYAGGMNSNRAYSYRDLGPKNSDGDPIGFMSLTEASLEYRFPIYDSFRGVLFSDFTFASSDFIPDYTKDGYIGAGVGIRYVTPVGPIAFDVGIDPNNTDQYAIHFRIGELF